MTPTRAIGWLAAKIRYRYLFAVWILIGCTVFEVNIDAADVSFGFSFLTEFPPSLFYFFQVIWIAVVDLIFVKGGLREDRPGEGGWRAAVVLVKWLSLPVFLLHLLPLAVGPYDWPLIAILLFTASWPLLVLVGWLCRPRDVPAH
jgi:hypothetical protein